MERDWFDLQRFAGDVDDAGAADSDQPAPEPDQQQTPAEEVVPKSELERVQRELEQARQQLQDVQRQLMDPRYLQWLAQQHTQIAAPTTATPPSAAQEPEEEPDFEKMSPREFARWIREQVKRELLSEVEPRIQSVAQNAEVARAQMEIEQASRKYPDFWMYRDAMIRVVREYEDRGVRLSVEDAYHIAKGRSTPVHTPQPRPVSPPRPRPAPAATERPGVSSVATSKTTLSATEAFEEAWKRAGLDKILGE